MKIYYEIDNIHIIKCDICDRIIRYNNQIRHRSYMVLPILQFLSDSNFIPDLCSENCCKKYEKILRNAKVGE